MMGFEYLDKNVVYVDSACQSLRPQPVIDAINEYYKKHNSCGERVKYDWGIITDEKVEATRGKVLKYVKKSPRHYFVSFTLNTTYGLNLILSQIDIKKAGIKTIVTSDIEHNSPFLSTISCAKKNHLKREVITRNEDGSINPDDIPERALVVVNCASNIDGRLLINIKGIIKKVHKTGGYIVIDAAQAMAHSSEILYDVEPDAICFSAHKMYAPSLGGIIIRHDFAKLIDTNFIGGGMVDDVDKETFLLSKDNKEHSYTQFEAGLQAWGEIIGLGASIDWLNSLSKKDHQMLEKNTKELFELLSSKEKLHLINKVPATTMSFYVDKKEMGYDSHVLGAALADSGIMARTGYFCVHYYLDHVKHYPPLIRFSLGYHNRPEDIKKIAEALKNF
ncbi:aminotransferase class V-fold PLP-dependent enzyme [Candidatus Saccharibacteria bacterium]|nr:aminotransferase class V-fold PLP-dependent enzyme [Candidatus Saccharibacteria bacterium]